jgi:hypothetical protein
MKPKQTDENVVYLKPFVDYRQRPKRHNPFYQQFTSWLTRSKAVRREDS